MIKLIALTFTISVLSALPPVESLFRNGSNKDIEADSVVLTFSVKEIKGSGLIELHETFQENNPLYEGFFKIILNKDASGKVEMVQAEYQDSDMKNDSLVRLYEGSSFIKYLRYKTDIIPERDIFYGILVSLLLNDSTAISNFLAKTNSDFIPNEKMINARKKELFEDYKKYLQTVNDEPSLAEELESPLKPTEEEKVKKVKEVLAESYYQDNDKVQLIKEGEKFFVLAKLEKIKAKFTNNSHKLVEFIYSDIRGDIRLKSLNYLLFNGVNEAPKTILYSYPDRNFKVEVKSLRYVSYRPKTFKRIKTSLRDALPKRKHEELATRPLFLF